MKKLIMTTLLIAAPLQANGLEFHIPSLKEQYENAKIDEVKAVFETDPYFAGKLIEINMFDRRVAVDRRAEPASGARAPAPGGLASLTDVLDGLDAGAKGKVEVDVTRSWHDNGQMKEEKWKIVIQGEYNVSKEKPAGEQKQDKQTGE
jgi:hypothetical protein